MKLLLSLSRAKGTWVTANTGFTDWRLVLQGYSIDLAKLISEYSTTKYEYKIDLVGDGNYGGRYVDYGCWDGMIGELISEEGCPDKSETRKVSISRGIYGTGYHVSDGIEASCIDI